jgi:hypothetical protein
MIRLYSTVLTHKNNFTFTETTITFDAERFIATDFWMCLNEINEVPRLKLRCKPSAYDYATVIYCATLHGRVRDFFRVCDAVDLYLQRTSNRLLHKGDIHLPYFLRTDGSEPLLPLRTTHSAKHVLRHFLKSTMETQVASF